MPNKHRYKTYVKGGYYHIYNRGVAKQKIFRGEQDYKIFLKYIKEALIEPETKTNKKIEFSLRGRTFKAVPRAVKNFQNEIELIAFCLMPNHFHLLAKQNEKETIIGFMRSLITRYSTYFNKKYKRVGPLFQGRYKAVLVTEDNYLLHLTRYIHLNPKEYWDNLTEAYSSYTTYLGLTKSVWIKPDIVIKFFNNQIIPELAKINNYKDFVENYRRDSGIILGDLTLE